MARSRYDRISEHKKQAGIEHNASGASGNNMAAGIPQFRSVTNHSSGSNDVAQYISDGLNLYKSTFNLVGGKSSNLYNSIWAISDEFDISSTMAQTSVYEIKKDTFVMGVSIWVTSAITAGSLDLDVGDGSDVDLFIENWDASGDSDVVNNILSFGRAIDAPTSEAGPTTGKYYSSTDTIDLRVATGASAGKIRLIINMLQKS